LKPGSVALLGVVAVLGAAAGFLTYRHVWSGAPSPKIATAAPKPSPEAAQAAVEVLAGQPALAIPEQVPDVKLPDLDGKSQALRAIPGHARLYNFWATWCEPCQREIPLLNTLASAYGPQQLQIVGIAVDERDAVQTFLKTTPLHYTVLVGEEEGAEAAQKFGMELALPFSVFADDHDRIIALKLGELHRDEADAILGHMKSLRAGTETLKAAQDAIAAALKTLAIERAKQSTK
jgi:thiol-disulfide isomerase/thioredoxin